MNTQLMNKSSIDTGASGNEPPIEPDKPPVLGLLAILAVATITLLAVGVACKQLLLYMTNKRDQDVNLSVPNPLFKELSAQYREELSTYEKINPEKGYYKIPIDQAMEALVKKESKNQ